MTHAERSFRELSQLRSLNLNLLPVLSELLRTRNVTRTGERLHLAQSSVSASLKRLREHFADPLLVMQGRDFVLTRRASLLMGPLEQTLRLVEELLTHADFDPATSDRRFVVAGTDHTNVILAERVADRPDGSLGPSIHFLQTVDILDELRSGAVDFVIAARPTIVRAIRRSPLGGQGIVRHALWQDNWVAIQRANPTFMAPSREQFLAANHIVFEKPCRDWGLESEALAEEGVARTHTISIDSALSIPFVVCQSSLMSIVPSSLAARFQSVLPIDTFPAPIRLPPLDYELLSTDTAEHDAGLTWLRSLLEEVVAGSKLLVQPPTSTHPPAGPRLRLSHAVQHRIHQRDDQEGQDRRTDQPEHDGYRHRLPHPPSADVEGD